MSCYLWNKFTIVVSKYSQLCNVLGVGASFMARTFLWLGEFLLHQLSNPNTQLILEKTSTFLPSSGFHLPAIFEILSPVTYCVLSLIVGAAIRISST